MVSKPRRRANHHKNTRIVQYAVPEKERGMKRTVYYMTAFPVLKDGHRVAAQNFEGFR
jgi:hypothetical protein